VDKVWCRKGGQETLDAFALHVCSTLRSLGGERGTGSSGHRGCHVQATGWQLVLGSLTGKGGTQ
jgi:hypothetical protein